MELMCDRIGIIQNGTLVDIQTLNDMLQDEKKTSIVYFNVSPLDKAKKVLDNLSSDYNSVIKGDELEITAKIEDIPAIVEKLVEEKIKIYGINKSTKNLESKFLEVTGGNEIE
jgi:ABC-2 type transport system ATP-binding protein